MSAGVISGALLLAVPAFAQVSGDNAPQQGGEREGFQRQMRPMGMMGRGAMMRGLRGQSLKGQGVMGTVTSVNGTTLVVSVLRGMASSTAPTSFTIDASSAAVIKNAATSTVSAISVGDRVMIRGTVSGTNVAATEIRDGAMMNAFGRPSAEGMQNRREGQGRGDNGEGNALPAITGNGQPVVVGDVTSITGTSVVITNKSNVTYTIDASAAKILKSGNASSTISNISVGDSIVVQGTVNGNSVAASSILDGGTKAAGAGVEDTQAPKARGFFGGVRTFFGRIFGF